MRSVSGQPGRGTRNLHRHHWIWGDVRGISSRSAALPEMAPRSSRRGSWEEAVRNAVYGGLNVEITFGDRAGQIEYYRFGPEEIADLSKFDYADEGYLVRNNVVDDGFPGVPVGTPVIVLEDQHKLNQDQYPSDTDWNDFGAQLMVERVEIDLAIDSNNDGVIDEADDAVEDGTGIHVAVVNRDDVDEDTIPDFADGFDWFDDLSEDATNHGDKFSKARLMIPGSLLQPGNNIRFDYSNSAPPDEVTRTEVTGTGLDDVTRTAYLYGPGAGKLRLWTADGSTPRTAANYLRTGVSVPVSELPFAADGSLSLFVEAVGGKATAIQITATLVTTSGEELHDLIQVLPLAFKTGISIPVIDGYTIIDGGSHGYGTAGNDIIFGTDSDDHLLGGGGRDIILTGGGSDFVEIDAGVVVFGDSYYRAVRHFASDRDGGDENDVDIWADVEGARYTEEDVLEVYGAIYGFENSYYHAFTQSGGTFKMVANDEDSYLAEVPESDLDENWSLRQIRPADSTVDDTFDYEIQLAYAIESPVIAAQILHAAITSVVIDYNDQDVLNKFNDREFLLEGTNELPRGLDGENLYKQRGQRLAQVTGAGAQLYLAGIGAVSRGADIALAFNDIFEGRVASGTLALALAGLPIGLLAVRHADGIVGFMARTIDEIPGVRGATGTTALDGLDAATVADSFVTETAQRIVLTEDLIVIRYTTEGSTGGTRHWLTTEALSASDARILLALPKSNKATQVELLRIPAGQEIVVGRAASKADDKTGIFDSDAVGGGEQIYLIDQATATVVRSPMANGG